MLLYLLPSSAFIVEGILMLLAGCFIGGDLISEQFAVNLRCAFWALAGASILSVIQICRMVRAKLKAGSFIDEDDFHYTVVSIHMVGGILGFVVLSLLLGGAAGGVVFEVLWFIKALVFGVGITIYSLLFSAIAVPVCILLCKRFRKTK